MLRRLQRDEILDAIDRGERDFSHIDLSNVDLSESDCAECDFTGANLRKSVFDNSNLSSCKFDHANLSHAHMKSANLVGASFVHADLHRADLAGADMTRANLFRTVAYRARLEETELAHANLRAADLSGANLQKANLTNADMAWADLSQARLVEANLEGTTLIRTIFAHARLEGANLERAHMASTIFARTNLTAAQNLENVEHHKIFGSHVDIDTLLTSGSLPRRFLKACNWPEEWVVHASKLAGRASPLTPECFFSYAREDLDAAERIAGATKQYPVLIHRDIESLSPGDEFASKLKEEIQRSDVFIIIVSKESARSVFVNREIALARRGLEEGSLRAVIPILLDDALSSVDPVAQEAFYWLTTLQSIDARGTLGDLQLKGIAKCIYDVIISVYS